MQGVFGGGVGWYDLFLRFIGAEPVGQTDPAFISVHSVGICGIKETAWCSLQAIEQIQKEFDSQ